jgi:hypothetical protein
MTMTEHRNGTVFYDRLTGSLAPQPPTTNSLMGRWILQPEVQETVFLNSLSLEEGDFLVSDASGGWTVLDESGVRTQGTVLKSQLLDRLEAESLRTLGNYLEYMEEKEWLYWLEISPLVPGMSEQVELLPLEKRLRELLGHLETVCQKPRTHLRVTVERVPVSKAKRIPPEAVSWLASHTEDWDRQLLRGVQPKRILSEVRQDEVNIYENQVTARLLDHLSAGIAQRIHLLKKLLKVFQEKEDYSSSSGGTHLRAKRIYKLWGESFDANEGRRKAENTLQQLEWLKYKLMGLMDSPLYRGVPRRTFVPTTLRHTNILANDQHYRRVAELWREWAQSDAGKARTLQEWNKEAQALCRSMDAFSMLLVIRALDSLDYEPLDKDEAVLIQPGVSLTLQRHSSRIELSWHQKGTLKLSYEEQSLLILPLPLNLAGATKEQLTEELERIRAAVEGLTSRVLILYPSSEPVPERLSQDIRQALHTVGNSPIGTEEGSVGILPVSPWEIGSIERVARAIRWLLDSRRLEDYPVTIKADSLTHSFLKSQDWFSLNKEKESLEILRPPADYEWRAFELKTELERLEGKKKEVEEEHNQLKEELNRTRRSGAKTGNLNQRASSAQEKLRKVTDIHLAFKELEREFEMAKQKAEELLICPVCYRKANSMQDFKPRGNGCYKCQCNHCNTSWATRLCGQGHRYAVILPRDKFFETGNTEPGWVDRVYGCDLLALPARKQNGEWGFCCPTCGSVS